MASLSAYRVYASTLSSIQNLQHASLQNELHIVLAFARDYDNEGNYQTGKFFPYFDTKSITPEVIKNIKESATATSVKIFLSIGGREHSFPFAVTSADQSNWIGNAIKSLRTIVQQYHIDGLDVYYEHMNAEAEDQFTESIHQVIWHLKNGPGDYHITQASITVSAPVINKYNELYKKHDTDFDYVVYQSHTEQIPISTFDALVAVFANLPYPKGKTLAGHSDVLPADWHIVLPPIFLGAIPQLLKSGIFGISKWIVTPNDYNPEPVKPAA